MTEDSKPETAPRFVIRQLGEIEFDGIEGQERISGLLLEAETDDDVRAAGRLWGQVVTVVSAGKGG